MKKNFYLYLIFGLALLVRLYCFRENVYFGFDEARDAYVSQSIYNEGDLKIIGPTASGVTGLNHGVLHWYLIGLFYLLGAGNPFVVALIFRVLNALAVFPIYWITKNLFGKRPAYLASIFFAVSFEATQYSIYYGNPSLAVWSWILLFMGAVIIYKKKNKFWGLPLMAIGIASGAQLELFLITLLPLGLIILGILRKELIEITLKSWLLAFVLGLGICSTYIIGELKNGFRSVTLILGLATNSYNSTSLEPKWVTYFHRWILMLHDNFAPLGVYFLWLLGLCLLGFIFYNILKNKIEYALILTWILGGSLVTCIGAYNVYYVNVGIGTGVVIGLAVFIDKILEKNKFLGYFLIFLGLCGNLNQIKIQSRIGLIQDIKTQQYMLLNDEVAIINKMYFWADNKSFTVRVTSMPYKIQTVWAYLFTHFALPAYGYLPYYESGNTLGYPGKLPEPKNGTTCIRFLLKEPSGGIPKRLFEADEAEENLFSRVDESVVIGGFVLERRTSKDKICYTNNFPKNTNP